MRIAIVPSADLSYNSGSIIYAKKLFNYLHENGHEAFLLASKKPDDIKAEYMKYIIVNPDLLEHPIIDDRKITDIEYGKSLTGTLNYLLGLQGIDLIHAHYGSFGSFAAYVANGLTGVPYIVSSFGRDINIGYSCDRRIRWLIEKSFVDAARIIVPEESVGTKLCGIFKNYSFFEKIIEIPMPLDKQIFEVGNLLIKENVPILSTINSCFSPEKGISTILRAFSAVLKEMPCKLFIAGQDDHPEQLHRKTLLEEVNRLGIEKDVVFLGYLNRQNVGNLLELSTLFIDARLKGNFSSVVLEAVFKSIPVIASDTEASKKIIRHDYNGYIYPPGDEESLRQIIVKCLQDQNMLSRIKNNMEKWVEENGAQYYEDGCFLKVLDTYKAVIKENG